MNMKHAKIWKTVVWVGISIFMLTLLSEIIQASEDTISDLFLVDDYDQFVYLPIVTKPLCPIRGNGGTETIEISARKAGKIRLDLITRAYEYGFSLWEVEIYGPGTGNLAAGATATASSWENNPPWCIECTPEKAIDQDLSTRWGSEFYEPQWLEITLPVPQLVDRFVLNWETAYATEYCISVTE
jgi:hypothetical protein